MEKTVYQQGGAGVNMSAGAQSQQAVNGMASKKTIYPGMQSQPTNAAAHNTPIAGFFYSVSRTLAGEFWPIYEGPNKIGRGADCVVQLNDPLVSDKHATLVVRPMYNANQKTGILVYIQDDASTCGTMLNGNSLGFEPKECHHGDILTIGPNYELYLMLVDAASVGLAPKEALQNMPANVIGGFTLLYNQVCPLLMVLRVLYSNQVMVVTTIHYLLLVQRYICHLNNLFAYGS